MNSALEASCYCLVEALVKLDCFLECCTFGRCQWTQLVHTLVYRLVRTVVLQDGVKLVGVSPVRLDLRVMHIISAVTVTNLIIH